MLLEAARTSRWLRVDPDAPVPAAPLPVRDLALDGDADADIDYQASVADLRAAWTGWRSVYGWISGYHVSLEAFDGAGGEVTVCAGVAVGNTTEMLYTTIPGCAFEQLLHGWTYRWKVRACGCNDLTTLRASDGVTVDTRDPILDGVYVSDGTGPREIDYQSHEVRVLSAHWGGTIQDAESPVAYLEWALGTGDSGAELSNVMDWTVARASCLPESTWCARCGPAAPGACAGPSTDVCVRVQYRMCAGQWGGLSTTVCRRWTPGCTGPVTFALQEHDSPEGLLGYRVYRVHPLDEDQGCLKEEVVGSALRPWTELRRPLVASCGGGYGPIAQAGGLDAGGGGRGRQRVESGRRAAGDTEGSAHAAHRLGGCPQPRAGGHGHGQRRVLHLQPDQQGLPHRRRPLPSLMPWRPELLAFV